MKMFLARGMNQIFRAIVICTFFYKRSKSDPLLLL